MVYIGPERGLPPMPKSRVMLHSKIGDPVKLAALRMLSAAFRSAAANT
jgi:hypothetical protein